LIEECVEVTTAGPERVALTSGSESHEVSRFTGYPAGIGCSIQIKRAGV
jgi:hypothetical protein